ncbi:MAG: 5-carboxymethyl-2-hydroxymuconate Delta-isomerase [Emcibacteraceae bacterium]|nr:5-carboxymethyl-2-hydroxymuconate Delta-isomerase [Emcibacteraceae bacterium]
MPHCIIEYTRDLEPAVDIRSLVNAAFESIEKTELFNRSAIKSRAIPLDYFKSGLDRDDYIHITVKILPGRNAEQKKLLTQSVMDGISAIVGGTKSLSVEVVDLDGDSYNKRVNEA